MTGLVLAAGEPGQSFVAIVASAARSAAALVGNAAGWWEIPSTSLLQPVVLGAHNALRPLLLLLLTASVLVQSIRIIMMRKGEPLLAVVTGLFRFAVAAALGITVLQGALWAGDVLATSLLGSGARSGAVAFGNTMREALTAQRGELAEPFLLLLLSVVVLVLAAAQWMAMALRQIGLLAVAATLPLAAAGSLTATTRSWLTRLLPWAFALVLYKPAAALIEALGEQYLRENTEPGGASVNTVLTGIVVLGLSVAVLPMSLRLLSWSTVRVSAAGGGVAGMPGAVGAIRLNARGSTSPSVQLATFMESAGPGSTQRLVTGAGSPYAPGAVTGVRAAGLPTGPPTRPPTAPPGPPTGPPTGPLPSRHGRPEQPHYGNGQRPQQYPDNQQYHPGDPR
jgi:type IV secretion system protein TrbL